MNTSKIKPGRKRKGEGERRRPVCVTLPPALLDRMRPLPYSHSYIAELGLEMALPFFEACADSKKSAPEIFAHFITELVRHIDKLAEPYEDSEGVLALRRELAAFVDQINKR